jgi:hypothetical protein
MRAGLQNAVPKSIFWLEKHNSMFRNARMDTPISRPSSFRKKGFL